MRIKRAAGFIIGLLVTITAGGQDYNTPQTQPKPKSLKLKRNKTLPATNQSQDFLTAHPPEKPGESLSPPSSSSLDRHIFVSALYSSANEIHYTGQVTIAGVQTPFAAVEQSSPAAGLAGGYVVRRLNSIGFSGDLTFELPRRSSTIIGQAGNVGVHGSYEGNQSNSLLTANANANWSIGADIYIFAGLNYPLTLTSGSGESLSGLPGYQGGAGYAFTDRISLEASYRVVRLKGTIDSPPFNLVIDEASLSGYLLAIHYLF